MQLRGMGGAAHTDSRTSQLWRAPEFENSTLFPDPVPCLLHSAGPGHAAVSTTSRACPVAMRWCVHT